MSVTQLKDLKKKEKKRTLGMVVHTYNTNTYEVEAGGLKFEASLSYKSLSQKIKAVNGVQPGAVSILNKVKGKESASGPGSTHVIILLANSEEVEKAEANCSG